MTISPPIMRKSTFLFIQTPSMFPRGARPSTGLDHQFAGLTSFGGLENMLLQRLRAGHDTPNRQPGAIRAHAIAPRADRFKKLLFPRGRTKSKSLTYLGK
ncbi:MAG: hypothetical protein ACRECY_10315 [Phyllobacterium sp.]